MADTTVSVETKLIGAQAVAQGFKDVAKAAESARESVAAIGEKTSGTSSIDVAAKSIVEQFAKAGEASAALRSSLTQTGEVAETALVKKFRESHQAAQKLREGVAAVGTEAQKALGGEATEAVSMFTKANILGSIAVAGLAAAVGYIAIKLWDNVQAASAYASALFDLSAASGKSAETLQGLDLAAKQSGTTMNEVVATINRLSSQLFRGAGTGGPGAGRLKHMLEAVGIDPATVRDGEDAMMRIADVMREMTATDRIVIAQQLGISTGMIQLLSQGSTEIKRLADETNSLRILSREATEAQNLFSASIVRMQTAAMGLANSLLNEFLPTIATMAARWADTLIAMGSAWEAFKTLVLKGLPGGDRFMEGLTNARENVKRLQAEFEQAIKGPPANADPRIRAGWAAWTEQLRQAVNEAKVQVAEYERVLQVTTAREQAGQPFIGPPLPPPKPFDRERRGGAGRDPSDDARETIRKLRITLAELAGEIDNSPEARQYRETIANLSRSFSDKDPKNNISKALFNEGALAAMDLFIAQREERLKKMSQQDEDQLQRSLTIAAAQLEAEQKKLDEILAAERKHYKDLAAAAQDALDPLGGFLRELEKTDAALVRLGIEVTPEVMAKMHESIAKGFTGMAKEAKEGNKAFEELLRAVEGFGRQFTDALYESFEQGENIIDAFFKNVAKLAAKRVLFETVGRPIDDMIKSLLGGLMSQTDSSSQSKTSSPSIWGTVFQGLGTWLGFGAEGMNIPPGFSAIVGERGHETVTAGAGGLTVRPLSNGGSTNYYNITIHSDVERSRIAYDVQRAIQASQNAMREDLYRGGSLSQILSTTGKA